MRPNDKIERAFLTTWPAAEYRDIGGFRVGRGLGGGGRLSSAFAPTVEWDALAISEVEAIQREWEEKPQFRVWDDDAALAGALTDAGWTSGRPTLVLEADVAELTDKPVPRLTAIEVWPLLAAQRQIWADGGLNDSRIAAMNRVGVPRISILGRLQDHIAGAAFVAADGPVVMIHAIQIADNFRRMGLAEWMLRQASVWGAANGADTLALAVTADNAPAVKLYDKLGFKTCGSYSYWSRPTAA